MSEFKKTEQNKVVQLNPERNNSEPHIALTRLPAAMHSLRDKARQQLQMMLRDLFDRADDALFELADKATNNHEQNLYFDSMREVRIRRRALESAFFRSIDVGFAQLLDPHGYRNTGSIGESNVFSADELSLVQNDELEELVATEGMVNKANDQFAEAIQHLTLRIDHLVPVKVYQKNNPLGADVICKAFIEASKALSIDVKAKLVLFKLFDNLVMAKLGNFFQALNQLLIEANILPSLKTGSAIKKSSTTSSAGHSQGQASGQSNASTVGAQAQPNYGGTVGSYDEQTNQVLHTLRDLLGSNSNGSANQAPRQQEIASNELIQILSQAQHSGSANYSGGAPLNVRDLLNDMLRGKEKNAINQVDDDVINLVSMMFEFILDDRNLAAPMKALLGRLQIPMIKVAIADKSFFSKGGHPARRLLNEMATAALGWQEAHDDSQRKDSLFGKMESIVAMVISDFESDMSIFNSLLMDFRSFLDKEKRRAQILEQRTIDAEDGKAKTERARADVEVTLNSLIGNHILPDPANKLLRDAWANVMFITCLKAGTQGEEWQAKCNVAQKLVWSLTAPMDKENRPRLLKLVPQLLQHLRQGLESISYNPFDATQLFKQLEVMHLARLRGDSIVQEAPAPQAVSAPAAKAKVEPIAAPVAPIAQPVKADVAAPVVESKKAEAKLETKVEAKLETQMETKLETKIEAKLEPVKAAPSQPVAASPAPAQPVAPEAKAPIAAPVKPEAAVVDNAAKPKVQVETPSVAEVVNAAQSIPVAAKVGADEVLPEGDQHLSLVANVTQGTWFEMVGEEGQKFRCRLAAIIRPTGKYIFVNRTGMKVAEETRNSLALALKSGRLRVLDDGMLFDRALEAVIGNLREGRPS